MGKLMVILQYEKTIYSVTGLSKNDFILSTGVEHGQYEKYDAEEIPTCSRENSITGRDALIT